MPIMRATSLCTLFAVCLFAVACSSTATSGGQGGQVGSGGAGVGGHQTSDGGNGAGGNVGVGGHATDAASDATAGTTDCHPACASGSVCVGSGVQGGAVFFADGGVCPAGRHAQGNICVQDLTFACMPIPSGCNGTPTCACASSLCSGRPCVTATSDEVTCILAVP